MKTATFLLSIILAFLCTDVSAKCHKHKKVKHEVPCHKAGHSKDSGRPKPVTSAEDRKKPPKKDRIGDRKRDRYGAFIESPRKKINPRPDDESFSMIDRCTDRPKIVKQPRPIDWDESY